MPIVVQQTLDHGINGPGGPDVSFTVLMGVMAAAAVVAHQHRLLLHDLAALHHLRARPGHAADQGLPPRPRPAAAHPEHRAPRRPGLPGDQRRRPGQPVPGLRRPVLHHQRRAGADRDGRDGHLQLAARAGGVGGVRAAVPLVALLPAQAVGGLRRGAPPDGRDAGGDLRAGRRRRRGPLLRRRGPHPGAASTTRSTTSARPARPRRSTPSSPSPSAASRRGWPTPA